MNLIEFYEKDILAVYQNNPDKYEIYTDNFEGRISVRDDYYEALLQEQRNFIDVQFGFRTKKDGELALAVYVPDLKSSSDSEQNKWQGFKIKDESIFEKEDERFKLFFNRYIVGDWNIDNGVLFKIQLIVSEINSLTEMTLNTSLFKCDKDVYLAFPSAENDHKYQDAHKTVYGFLLDGLQMPAIKRLALIANTKLDKEIKKTLKALKQILPVRLHEEIIEPLRNVSNKRGPAAHNTREYANKFPAFSQFNSDMEEIYKSLNLLKEAIEKITSFSAEVCMKRKNKLEMLPKFDLARKKEIQPNYSIYKFNEIVGKTIEKVEIGFRENDKYHPDNELAFLHFTDGSILSISIASNFIQLQDTNKQEFSNKLKMQFHLNFVLPLIKNNLEDKK